MEKTETGFLKTQNHQLFVWFRYIDNKFFNWIHSGNLLTKFMEEFKFVYKFVEELNQFLLSVKFTYAYLKKNLHF